VERLASGMGVSDVAAVRADAVDGKKEAEARTVARRAKGVSSGGGEESVGMEWKRVGWALSIQAVSDSNSEKTRLYGSRTNLEQLGIDSDLRE
jgi:hypothetical protein